MSRGLGRAQRAILDHLSDGALDGAATFMELPPALIAPSVSTRRAASTLQARGWVDLRHALSHVEPLSPGPHAVYDDDLAYWVTRRTGKRVTMSRYLLQARFANAEPPFAGRITPIHLRLFEELLELRIARASDHWRTATKRPFAMHPTTTRQKEIFDSLVRDRVRWIDAMGPSVKPTWVYFRWESWARPEQKWP